LRGRSVVAARSLPIRLAGPRRRSGQADDPATGTSYTTPMPGCAALPAPSAGTSGIYDDAFDWGCSSTVFDFPPDATPMIWHERAAGVTKMRVRRRL